jgi:probable HAF family extracellular repeat protein
MNTKHHLITCLSAVALTACVAIGVASAGAETYSLTDLGILPGKKENASTAAAINDSGQVAGTSAGTAFRYTRERKISMEDVGKNPYGITRGFGLSSSGQVVGDSTFGAKGSISRAALFGNGAAKDLGTLKGWIFSRANGINASGQVVGFAGQTLDSDHGRAFLVETTGKSNSLIDLGTLGGDYAQAWGINDSGYVTGHAQPFGINQPAHAFIWHLNMGMVDLGTLAGDFSYGTFINANNHVVGYSTIDKNNDRVHAFLHDGKDMLDLGSLGGASMDSDNSYALGVNSSDQVVGYSYTPVSQDAGLGLEPPIQQVAFLYRQGVMVDLNNLIGGAAKEYRLYSATAINDKGQIAAIAYVNAAGDYHAVVLTPIVDIAPTPVMEITSATYTARQTLLTVKATYGAVNSGLTPPTLTVYGKVSGQAIGVLFTKGTGGYFGSFVVKSNPKEITVMSSDGGRKDAFVEEMP